MEYRDQSSIWDYIQSYCDEKSYETMKVNILKFHLDPMKGEVIQVHEVKIVLLLRSIVSLLANLINIKLLTISFNSIIWVALIPCEPSHLRY